ncbi:MAG TPA: AgmX/PglI C-terminal domain-containing protein, partial [Labilithrix sp.]
DPNAPTVLFGRDESLGSDPLSARGNMWGNEIGESFGGGGLGLTGVGQGGGGDGAGVGLDHVHTVGNGAGDPNGKWGVGKCTDPSGKCEGMGIGHGPGQGGYKPKQISIRTPETTTNGRLPAEVIQRIVRQNFGRFRLCYESGLRTNPGLNGRVVTTFVIDRNGAVSIARDGGSDLPDQSVVQCIVRSFANLSFPQPDGGVATVTYPIILSPGDS